MKRFKLFEDFAEEPTSGYITVPPDFEERLKGAHAEAKRKQEIYKVPKNGIRIDLWYNLKDAIYDFLRGVKDHYIERTQVEYERVLNREIDGSMYKYSEYIVDETEVRNILWKYINERLPYDEVDYHYTYELREKLLKLTEEFVNEIIDKKLMKLQ